MTNNQFLTAFQHHLNVGGPQRDEIIAEMKSHLEEEGTKKLGDPKMLAQKSNRVHLGFFSSFKMLLWLRMTVFLVFESGWLLVSLQYFSSSPAREWWWVYSVNIITQLFPALVFIYGSYLIGHFRRRWLTLATWVATFAAGATLMSILQEKIGYVLVASGGERSPLMEYLGQLSTLYIVFGAIALGIMVATEGKNMLWPKHIIASTIGAFIIITIATYFALPLVWNVITGYRYTEFMSTVDVWIFEHQHYLAVSFGLIGASLEWLRHSTKK
jgi:hypothetical protein